VRGKGASGVSQVLHEIVEKVRTARDAKKCDEKVERERKREKKKLKLAQHCATKTFSLSQSRFRTH